MPLLDLVTGWALFLALAACLGAVLGRWFVLPAPDASGDLPAAVLRTSAARFGRGAATLLVAALGLVFVRQLVEFHDPFAPWSEDAGILLRQTPWGTTWVAALVVAVVALVSLWVAGRGRTVGWWPATLSVLALGAFPALTGHANAGSLRPLTLTADTFHVWAVGGWIGGMALVLVLERRHGRGRSGDARSLLPVLVPRFSPMAMACVGTLLVTGVLAAWIHLPGLGALFSTRYGRLLVAKVALVLGVLALGGLNWRRLTPRLGGPPGQDALRRAATAEFIVANVVLAVTAILVRTSPR